MATNNLKVTRALPGNSESALVNAVMPKGMHVVLDASSIAGQPGVFSDVATFAKATGKKAFLLERDVVAPPIPLETIVFEKDFITPEITGSTVSARKVQEYEVEGPDLVLVTGTNQTTPAALTISAIDVSDPALITTTAAHGLVTGQSVTISGSNSTPVVDGTFAVTVISPTKFQVPVHVTVAGTAGSVQPATPATNAITSSTPVGTELSTANGAVSIKQPSEERHGWLRGQLAVADASNPCRLLVEVDTQ